MKTKPPPSIISSIAALLLTITSAAPAAVIITYAEKPDATTSSLIGTDVFTFDNLKKGVNKNVGWDGVGTFNQLYIKKADAYGGAATDAAPKGSQYSLQGAGTQVLSSTLTLDKSSSYFGLWWSAGDPYNVLSFYNGDTLVGQFTTASLMEPLPAEYDGNPLNRSINKGEPYAFINFFGDPNTNWDKIVLTNNQSSGFESDNYTSRVEAWNPLVDGALPGVPVALVSGKDTKLVTAADLEGTLWSAAPGAPLPPFSLLAVFGLVIIARSRQFFARQNAAA